MEPIRIKYYHLIPMTKRGYLITTAVAGLIAGGVFVLFWAFGLLPPLGWSSNPPPRLAGSGFGPWFLRHFYHILGILVLLEAVDIFLTLRRFAQKEAEQRARLSQAQPSQANR